MKCRLVLHDDSIYSPIMSFLQQVMQCIQQRTCPIEHHPRKQSMVMGMLVKAGLTALQRSHKCKVCFADSEMATRATLQACMHVCTHPIMVAED